MSEFIASPRKLADPLGWPFGNLPAAVLERARRERDLREALKIIAERAAAGEQPGGGEPHAAAAGVVRLPAKRRRKA